MIMINKNNQSIKYSLTNPKLCNPSILCKNYLIFKKRKLNDVRDLAPGSYNPKNRILQRNTETAKIFSPVLAEHYKKKKELIQDPGKKALIDRAKNERKFPNSAEEENKHIYNTISCNTMLKEDEVRSSISYQRLRGNTQSHPYLVLALMR
ncbi:unnamed protein product [Moneuplotes crassus]|uniref:Uncharacterized protein n=1 Tax=Euplotes crassus TaxID=5936 RepID=A0AAD1XAT8_EUPCR|nr:unnamed protein product [Moneuplotes crassus]